MGKPEGKLAWVAKDDLKQYQWAMRYLKAKGFDVSWIQSRADLVSWSLTWPDGSETRELVNKMKLAWRQKKLRDGRNGKRAYNFVLATSAKKQLDELAKGQGLSVTCALEKLISGKFDLQRIAEKQLRETRRVEKSRDDSDFYHLAATTLGGVVGATLAELSKFTIQLNEVKKTSAEIIEPQQREVEELFKQKKAELFARLSFVESWDIMKFKRLIKPPKNN
ncbi:MAG: hypothetical protein KKC24_08655 [Gammaproteobacteria bacterium]|nr:hypothetical protein [Gammaproteobacteria bacterium]MBU0818907.1 hypothetical protein [Gammaproteobacteria bacterium]MBU0844311.1 hypothetical protein [Gammaproteobacteria bacterium]MBU1843534.1 hypothetical protein [Gammaproteobacteria bacterium]